MKRLVPPEVYPLIVSVGAAAGIAVYTLKVRSVMFCEIVACRCSSGSSSPGLRQLKYSFRPIG
jgi:NADH-ubiquinone reductase complex 1 MLRQ subunit